MDTYSPKEERKNKPEFPSHGFIYGLRLDFDAALLFRGVEVEGAEGGGRHGSPKF